MKQPTVGYLYGKAFWIAVHGSRPLHRFQKRSLNVVSLYRNPNSYSASISSAKTARTPNYRHLRLQWISFARVYPPLQMIYSRIDSTYQRAGLEKDVSRKGLVSFVSPTGQMTSPIRSSFHQSPQASDFQQHQKKLPSSPLQLAVYSGRNHRQTIEAFARHYLSVCMFESVIWSALVADVLFQTFCDILRKSEPQQTIFNFDDAGPATACYRLVGNAHFTS